MKKLKAFLCLALLLCMVMSLAMPAYAGTYSSGSCGANPSSGGGGGGVAASPLTHYLWNFEFPYSPLAYPFIQYTTSTFSEPTTFYWKAQAKEHFSENWNDLAFMLNDYAEYSVDNCLKYAILTYTQYDYDGTGYQGWKGSPFTTFWQWDLIMECQKHNTPLWTVITDPISRLTPKILQETAKEYLSGTSGAWAGGEMVKRLLPGTIPDADLVDEISNGGFVYKDDEGWYWNDSLGEALDAVYITQNNYWEEESTSTNESKIVIVRDETDYDGLNFDYTGETAEWLWDNAPTSGSYYGITGPTDTGTYNDEINIMTYKITKTHNQVINWEYDGNGNKTGNYEIVSSDYSYSKSYNRTFTKNIQYIVYAPSNPQVWYRPFNLNTSTQCTDDLVKTYYPEYSATDDLLIDSDDGNVDGTGIELLDINTPKALNISFGNTTWGLPSSFNLNKDQPYTSYKKYDGTYRLDVLNETGKISTWTGVFGRGASHDGVLGYKSNSFRWNPVAYAASCAPSGDSNSFSLQVDDGYEYIGTDEIEFGWQSPVSFVLKARTVLDNTYYLCNGYRDKLFWELGYTQGTFQTYGAEYEGTYDVNGISDATLIDHDFYCRIGVTNLLQPLLYGKFDTASVGGSVG